MKIKMSKNKISENMEDEEVVQVTKKLQHELNKAIIEGNDAISYLIVINEMWWERFNKSVISDIPRQISLKTRQAARGLYVFLNLDRMRDENEWMNIMADLTNDYRDSGNEQVSEEEDELGDPYG